MSVSVNPSLLDALCPMHLAVSGTGHITHVGPTLRKLRPGRPWTGLRFLETFRLVRPRSVSSMTELRDVSGRKLHMELREPPRTPLKACAVPTEDGGFIVNFAFGLSVVESVRDYALTNADFAATDLTIEMLYLLEAQSAAMDASRLLNAKLQGAKAAAERQAFTDPLTGLGNRRAMDMALARLVAARSPLALMHVDLDRFKLVNDTLGHGAGDHVLSEMSRLFLKETGREDVVARIGGDEFVIILPGLTDVAKMEELGRRILDGLETPVDYCGSTCRISGSIGTVIWNGCSPASPETLTDDADFALYASKAAGRARHTLYSPGLRGAARNVHHPGGGPVAI